MMRAMSSRTGAAAEALFLAALLAVLLPVLLLLLPGRAAAQQADSREVFRRFEQGVVQIRLVEAESSGKSAIGTGFAVAGGRRLVTNFHVVSDAVHHPERYRVESVDDEEESHELRLLAFDVVHDLAVLEPPEPLEQAFELAGGELDKGTRIWSLGNPFDLGLSIVEGTYNGLLEHSRYRRIHFTGSLNPGMSGGPAILANGRVVGVNVSTAGEQVSFLVPSAQVRKLVEPTVADGFAPVEDLTAELRRQLVAYQGEYLDDLLERPVETVEIGPYTAPSRPAPYFNCWGDAVHDEDDDRYEAHAHRCSTQDQVYVSREQVFSIMTVSHQHVKSTELATSQFYELYSQFFESNHSEMWGSADETTPLRCRTRFVETRPGLRFKATFCARLYRELGGLYDVVFKAAALGRRDEGFETALVLRGVDYERAERLARRHLEAIQWSP
jgi:S1-C subfamily serine protease